MRARGARNNARPPAHLRSNDSDGSDNFSGSQGESDSSDNDPDSSGNSDDFENNSQQRRKKKRAAAAAVRARKRAGSRLHNYDSRHHRRRVVTVLEMNPLPHSRAKIISDIDRDLVLMRKLSQRRRPLGTPDPDSTVPGPRLNALHKQQHHAQRIGHRSRKALASVNTSPEMRACLAASPTLTLSAPTPAAMAYAATANERIARAILDPASVVVRRRPVPDVLSKEFSPHAGIGVVRAPSARGHYFTKQTTTLPPIFEERQQSVRQRHSDSPAINKERNIVGQSLGDIYLAQMQEMEAVFRALSIHKEQMQGPAFAEDQLRP
ncbi:hypothetical protein HK105_208751 [Polyrhizophydium stewartii]|uniref:Uncharacterized protein n=1 Tax=Polyrhizophydium stewartii TaxID=2732419 RepID=A0ABR4MWX9_9FUNG